eukprot:gene12183-biopygen15478
MGGLNYYDFLAAGTRVSLTTTTTTFEGGISRVTTPPVFVKYGRPRGVFAQGGLPNGCYPGGSSPRGSLPRGVFTLKQRCSAARVQSASAVASPSVCEAGLAARDGAGRGRRPAEGLRLRAKAQQNTAVAAAAATAAAAAACCSRTYTFLPLHCQSINLVMRSSVGGGGSERVGVKKVGSREKKVHALAQRGSGTFGHPAALRKCRHPPSPAAAAATAAAATAPAPVPGNTFKF